ncbi:hypothetical protein FHR90_000956 [Endobacter medicaginis]|uniref:DUF3018 family protein n=1 Tax=Endobacter medicaginis TaxID=1181271 RepID=A0A839USB2_9PROT|nr:antitoxin MazE-like protein [Endobacter medicaginis]MBB3173138.1 hypothetical protein [Endobacter medicaginis]MCX5476968.1 DUF3018 family protein [Endobacter medicaginis]NVN31685.1 DUF3018 family protein [Endobacter medicaginis]
MPVAVSQHVRKRRDGLRAAGLRPIRVPDTRRPGFAEACRHQSRIAAAADRAADTMDGFLDAALADLDADTGMDGSVNTP